jgi:phosphatidylserine/phosphatidylglycerophosphate/cardiolipin synthase-like enzyme
VAAYGIENHDGVPVYVHAKVCVIDDTWASIGSDNFSRRSWTHDSELSAVVLDEDYARDLRLTLAAEHLDRLDAVAEDGLRPAMADCLDPVGMFEACASRAADLEAWHAGGMRGERPPGRLRPLPMPRLTDRQRAWAALPLDLVHDPDGRPKVLRETDRY